MDPAVADARAQVDLFLSVFGERKNNDQSNQSSERDAEKQKKRTRMKKVVRARLETIVVVRNTAAGRIQRESFRKGFIDRK
jgi:hypothetical protein